MASALGVLARACARPAAGGVRGLAAGLYRAGPAGTAPREVVVAGAGRRAAAATLSPSRARGFAAAATKDVLSDLEAEYEHATGLEKLEIEKKLQGVDMFKEDWLDAPFGTAESPVLVTSDFPERIVGVTDPEDDTIIVWDIIKEGEPPKQIVEGGEFFVLTKP